MADLLIDADTVTVALSTAEKLESLHGDVTVPRTAIRSVREVADGTSEVHGLKVVGAGLTGVLKVGSWRADGVSTFAVCHGHRAAVVIELSGASYDRLVVTVDDVGDAISRLR